MPIPLEFLYQDVDTTQVIVTSNGQEAICGVDSCNFEYVANSAATLTSFSLSGLTLTIIGTDFPTSDFEVRFGLNPCQISSGTATEIVCILLSPPYAGDYVPKILTLKGQEGSTSGLTPYSVSATISSTSPSTNLKQEGGELLTINGAGFPRDMQEVHALGQLFSVKISDVPCHVETVSATVITCRTHSILDSITSPVLEVSVNGKSVQ